MAEKNKDEAQHNNIECKKINKNIINNKKRLILFAIPFIIVILFVIVSIFPKQNIDTKIINLSGFKLESSKNMIYTYHYKVGIQYTEVKSYTKFLDGNHKNLPGIYYFYPSNITIPNLAKVKKINIIKILKKSNWRYSYNRSTNNLVENPYFKILEQIKINK